MSDHKFRIRAVNQSLGSRRLMSSIQKKFMRKGEVDDKLELDVIFVCRM